MTLTQCLLADLQRQYYFNGQAERRPRVFDLWLSVFNPRFLPVVLCRVAHRLYTSPLSPFARLVSLLNFVLFGIEIAMRCEIGEGLYFPHTVGTVIGAQQIGRNAVIYHGVTLGAKEIDLEYSADQRPQVGDNVVLGSGAKVLGGISIGDNAVVGANAVVLESVPAGMMVGGVPAKILRQIDALKE
jgi:serine O-acetyltransferase